MSDQDLEHGARFGDFTIDAVVGRGGMGVVYRATQERLGRLVALKLIAPHLSHDPDFRARFQREATMAAAIDHPSILPIYQADELDGQPFIVMRYVDGTDLKTLIQRRGRLPVDSALDITGHIAGALDAAHRRGLVHRDVKPANILIGGEADDQVVYLTDFGLTKGRSDERLTQTGKWVGTVDYIAPEQIEGKDYDGHADQYALACVLYEALTGSVPYPRDTDVQIMWAHIRDDAPSASKARPELGPAVDAVIARGMAKDPAARYATCRELVRAARDAIGSGAASAAPVAAPAALAGGTIVGTVVDGDAPPPPPPAAPPPAGPPTAPGDTTPPAGKPAPGGRSRTPLIAAAAVAGLLVVGVIAAVALSGGGTKKVTVTTVESVAVATVTVPAPGDSTTSATGGPVGQTATAPEDTGPASSAPPASTAAPDSDTGAAASTSAGSGSFPPASASEVLALAQKPVPFVALYTLIQGGDAGTLLLAYDGADRVSYRVRLKDQGSVWAGFDAQKIVYGCKQPTGADAPQCTDGTDDEAEYKNLIQQFVSKLISADAVKTNFGALASQDPPVLPGEQTGVPVACIQSVGAGTARLCVRDDSIITEVTVIEAGKEVGVRAQTARPDFTDADFAPPAGA